jgi:hypothetical protein
MAMNKLIAIGLVCCCPMGLAAEDPSPAEAFLGMTNVLVIDETSALADGALCARAGDKTECMSFNRAVLTAHTQKVSVLRERGRWM